MEKHIGLRQIVIVMFAFVCVYFTLSYCMIAKKIKLKKQMKSLKVNNLILRTIFIFIKSNLKCSKMISWENTS